MRKYLLLVLTAIFISSCTSEVDDAFQVPASQRVQQTLDRAAEVLRSAEYGWELDYYADSDLSYGGVVYIVKFRGQQADVRCSLIPDSVATSYYKLTGDNGPVLTFDTYNPLLHYYATPNSNEYEAKGGDFEFVIDSIADDFISVYGKKSHNQMCLRRLSQPVDDYEQQTIDIFDHFVDSIRGSIGDVGITAKYNPTNKSLIMNNGQRTITVPFAFTNRGIRFYQPLSVGGKRVRSFDFDRQTNRLSCTDSGADDVVLEGIPYAADFMSFARYEADYNLIYEGGSAPVHLHPNRLEGTYLMQGLSPKYNLVMRYVPETGNLTLGSQVIGSENGNVYYWVAYDYVEGNLSLADEGQFTIAWNKNRFYPSFNITATNPRVLNCNGGLLIYVYTNADGDLAAGIVDDSAWLTNNTMQFRGLKSLNRKTRME